MDLSYNVFKNNELIGERIVKTYSENDMKVCVEEIESIYFTTRNKIILDNNNKLYQLEKKLKSVDVNQIFNLYKVKENTYKENDNSIFYFNSKILPLEFVIQNLDSLSDMATKQCFESSIKEILEFSYKKIDGEKYEVLKPINIKLEFFNGVLKNYEDLGTGIRFVLNQC